MYGFLPRGQLRKDTMTFPCCRARSCHIRCESSVFDHEVLYLLGVSVQLIRSKYGACDVLRSKLRRVCCIDGARLQRCDSRPPSQARVEASSEVRYERDGPELYFESSFYMA